MELIINIFAFLDSHVNGIFILSLIVGGIWTLVKFRERIRDKRFKTYHELINWLVDEQAHADRKLKLDRQIAVVYELRNFSRYFDVSKRILKGLLMDWKAGDKRILEEISLSIEYMEKGYIRRLFKR